MPTTIPYDPALVMGGLVNRKVLENLEDIAKLQEPIDAAQYELNDKIALKNSLQATIIELTDMGVPTTELEKKSAEVGELIKAAGVHYANIRIKQEDQLQGLRGKVLAIHDSVESPIDWNRTQILSKPLSSDSMKMDIQYFSYDENSQNANNSLSSIKSFVTASFGGVLEPKVALATAHAAASQIANQREHHDISGTLVLTAACTHKRAQVLAPFILDVDKAIRVWNKIYTDDKDKIKVGAKYMREIADEEGTKDEKFLDLISGATYGSSFVGMVHILKSSETTTSQDMESTAASFQSQIELGSWFSNMSGGLGVDSTVANDVKNLLSTANVNSHVSLIVNGLIPSIKSNELETVVKKFTTFNPQDMMNQMAVLANATQGEHQTMQSSAQAARTGGEMIAWKTAEIKGVIGAVSEVDAVKDKVMNVQSMITAFEDYVDKAISGEIGVPINFFLKSISRAQLAEMWSAKYFPNKYLMISGDDSARPAAAPGSASAAPGATDAPTDASATGDASSGDSNSN